MQYNDPNLVRVVSDDSVNSEMTVTCEGVALYATYKTSFGARDYRQYSAIADLHTLQFAVTHALGFSVFTSRILATDFVSLTATSNYTLSLLFTA
jgi:hypothetical protein